MGGLHERQIQHVFRNTHHRSFGEKTGLAAREAYRSGTYANLIQSFHRAGGEGACRRWALSCVRKKGMSPGRDPGTQCSEPRRTRSLSAPGACRARLQKLRRYLAEGNPPCHPLLGNSVNTRENQNPPANSLHPSLLLDKHGILRRRVWRDRGMDGE